jgi:hypothetical protein
MQPLRGWRPSDEFSPQSRLAALRRHCGVNVSVRSPSEWQAAEQQAKTVCTPCGCCRLNRGIIPPDKHPYHPTTHCGLHIRRVSPHIQYATLKGLPMFFIGFRGYEPPVKVAAPTRGALTPYSLLECRCKPCGRKSLRPYSPSAPHTGGKPCGRKSLRPYSPSAPHTGGKPCGRKSLRPYTPSAPRLRRHRQHPPYSLLLTPYLARSALLFT